MVGVVPGDRCGYPNLNLQGPAEIETERDSRPAENIPRAPPRAVLYSWGTTRWARSTSAAAEYLACRRRFDLDTPCSLVRLRCRRFAGFNVGSTACCSKLIIDVELKVTFHGAQKADPECVILGLHHNGACACVDTGS